ISLCHEHVRIVPLRPIRDGRREVLLHHIECMMHARQAEERVLGLDLSKLALDELAGDVVLRTAQQQEPDRECGENAVTKAASAVRSLGGRHVRSGVLCFERLLLNARGQSKTLVAFTWSQ